MRAPRSVIISRRWKRTEIRGRRKKNGESSFFHTLHHGNVEATFVIVEILDHRSRNRKLYFSIGVGELGACASLDNDWDHSMGNYRNIPRGF